MVRFECDGCGALKKNGEIWTLGFAAENIGVTAARREITIASHWDDRNAREWLAVHFCSDECREDYMGRMFAEAPATKMGTRTVLTKRTQRVLPGGRVETMVTETEKPVIATATRRRKRA